MTHLRSTFASAVVLRLAAASFHAAGQSASHTTGSLTGKIVDSYEHARINRAYLLVHKFGDIDRTATVDSGGSFSIELPAGVYEVFVSAVGFDPGCRKLEVQPGKRTVYNVELKASTIGLED